MEFDGNIKSFLNIAFENKQDVFLKMRIPDITELFSDSIKTVVFLPGAFASYEDAAFADAKEAPSEKTYNTERDFIVADIRFLNRQPFREYLIKNSFVRIVLLFAECSDISEYGYRESFFSAGEFRDTADYYCQLVSFFSPSETDIEDYVRYFGCENVISLGKNSNADFTCYEAVNAADKFRVAAAEAEKSAFRKVCIYFNSRSEALDFATFLSKRGTDYCRVDGSMDMAEKYKNLYKFRNGKCCILIVTKSFIPDSLFFECDRCIICGAPFSLSHLYRCSYAASDRTVDIIYCENDFLRNEKIISSFSLKTEDTSFYKSRMNRLLEIKNLLKRGT